jgi:hypothetical protein
MFTLLKHNANAIIEGSIYMRGFLVFLAHFTNFLYANVASVFLVTHIHHMLEVSQLLEVLQLLEVHLLSL